MLEETKNRLAIQGHGNFVLMATRGTLATLLKKNVRHVEFLGSKSAGIIRISGLGRKPRPCCSTRGVVLQGRTEY